MSFLMVHLEIGYRLLEKCDDIKDRGAFLLGTISPDSIMFRPGCKRSDKSLTHFCVGGEGWGCYTNYDEWLKSLLDNIGRYKETVDKDFLFGYMTHIITDIENTRRYVNPIRLTKDKRYMDLCIKDGMEIDSILLHANKEKEKLWSLLGNANKHCLDGIFTTEDNYMMIDKLKSEMYFNRYPDSQYTPNVFSIQTMYQFIDDVVCMIEGYKYTAF